MSSAYSYIEASTQIKVGGAKLKGIYVSAAADTPTIAIHDSAAASTDDPVVLAEFTPTANQFVNFYDGVYLGKGIYVVIDGTVGATVLFE
jgi:hypothetical protein